MQVRPHLSFMSLKVFDLQCEHGHVFEGWFGSADTYESQKAGGLLSCPVCSSSSVNRKVSAARLNVGHLKRERLHGTASSQPGQNEQEAAKAGSETVQAPAESPDLTRIQAEIIRHMRKVLRETENVGSDFAQESRRIHHGESEERPIRGTATPQERAALSEEGIAVMAIPDFLDDDRLQ